MTIKEMNSVRVDAEPATAIWHPSSVETETFPKSENVVFGKFLMTEHCLLRHPLCPSGLVN